LTQGTKKGRRIHNVSDSSRTASQPKTQRTKKKKKKTKKKEKRRKEKDKEKRSPTHIPGEIKDERFFSLPGLYQTVALVLPRRPPEHMPHVYYRDEVCLRWFKGWKGMSGCLSSGRNARKRNISKKSKMLAKNKTKRTTHDKVPDGDENASDSTDDGHEDVTDSSDHAVDSS
jgi:hypothetical protein